MARIIKDFKIKEQVQNSMDLANSTQMPENLFLKQYHDDQHDKYKKHLKAHINIPFVTE